MSVSSPSKRDRRIDFLRGFALLTIFIDHVPGNFLDTLTLRNFGFSDAAELFVVLAGFSSMLAYGKQFERAGTGPALRKVALRCLRIYLFQVGMLILTLVLIRAWLSHFGMVAHGIAPLLYGGVRGLGHGLVLHALPSNLNILPLYIVLLALFPLLYLGMRRHVWLTLLISGAVWAAANFNRGLNLPNWMDGQGWFFNPFAWQFLFAIGVAAAAYFAGPGRSVPYRRWAVLLCWGYLGFALLAMAPWTNWGWTWKPVDIPTDKTSLAPLRLLNILAFMYVCMTSTRFAEFVQVRWLGFVELCGRHSLEVFATGTMLSLLGRLLFRTFGTPWEMQLLVNGAGFACMIGVALLLERPKAAAAGRAEPRPGGVRR
jgi:hypothetical protein